MPLRGASSAVAESRRKGTAVVRERIAVSEAARTGYKVPGTTRWGRIRKKSRGARESGMARC